MNIMFQYMHLYLILTPHIRLPKRLPLFSTFDKIPFITHPSENSYYQ